MTARRGLLLAAACLACRAAPPPSVRLVVDLVLPDAPDPSVEVATLSVAASWNGGDAGVTAPLSDGGIDLPLPQGPVDVTVLGLAADGQTLWRGIARGVPVPADGRAGPAVATVFFGKVAAFSTFDAISLPPLAGSTAVPWGDGQVLVSGGRAADGGLSTAIWLYDQGRVAFEPFGQSLLPRAHHLALALTGAPGAPRLFLAGGDGPGGATDTAEILDADGGDRPLHPLSAPQIDPSGALTADGSAVLVGCGRTTGSAAVDVYGALPGVGGEGWLGALPLGSPCLAGQVTLLPGVGDVVGDGQTPPELSVYEGPTPDGGTLPPFGAALAQRTGFGATAADGGILQMGGWSGGKVVATSEWHLSNLDAFPGPQLSAARADFGWTTLPDGKVLVVGGVGDDGGALASAETIDLSTGVVAPAGSLAHARIRPAVADISGYGAALVISGEEADGGPVGGLEIYTYP